MHIDVIVYAILAAFIIGAGYLFYVRRYTGELVRRLLAIDACSPENAVSLDELDYKLTKAESSALKRGSSLTRTVKLTESGSFYIEPSQVDRAKSQYKQEGTTIYMLAIIIIALIFVAAVLGQVIPLVVDMFTERFGTGN